MSKGNISAFFGGVVLGGTIGTVVGLLIAPRTGRETRQILKKSTDALPELAEDLSTTIQLQADRFSDSAMRNWEDTLERLRDAVSAGIEATQIEAQVQHNRSLSADSSSSGADQHL